MSGNIVILLLDPEAVHGTLFHPGGIGDVNLYRKSIDKSLMLYGKWLSNITSVNDKVVLSMFWAEFEGICYSVSFPGKVDPNIAEM